MTSTAKRSTPGQRPPVPEKPARRSLTLRQRLLILAVICIVVAVGSVAYFVEQRSQAQELVNNAPPIAVSNDLSVLATDHVVFRSAAIGPTYGKLSVVPLSNPAGPRVVFQQDCDRVYATATDGVCLLEEHTLAPVPGRQLFDAELKPTTSAVLVGTPSRARFSPDGTLLATTTFVLGDSYAVDGAFSTQTLIRRPEGDLNLEDVQATVDGAPPPTGTIGASPLSTTTTST